MTNTMSNHVSHSPCGGSVAPSETTSTCECGGVGCMLCKGQGFVRPSFFAGQLLTEEDLELLTSYAIQKNRLHNRYLFGEGVVCGLLVTCHPCGGGKVIVKEGYALDCCGNDIYLPCSIELDINAMVHRMRVEKVSGFDCGDPCGEKVHAGNGSDQRGQVQEEKVRTGDASREYCLYLRYCEEAAEPVSAYMTDEPCGVRECQPTRIREGFKFELRCRDEKEPPPDIFDRLCECVGDLVKAQRSALDARTMSYLMRTLPLMLESFRRMSATGQPPEFGDRDDKQLEQSTGRLEQALPRAIDAGSELTAAENSEFLDAASQTAGFYTLFHARGQSAREELLESHEGLQARLARAHRALVQTEADAPRENIEKLPQSEFDLEVGRAVLENVTSALQPDFHTNWKTSFEHHSIAHRLVTTSGVQKKWLEAIVLLRETLLDAVDRGVVGDCKLRELLAKVTADAQLLASSTTILLEALKRYLCDCICAALNPPCPPCDDAGVLLACLKFEDCEVIEICNLERTLVLHWPAMRYWIPFLRMFGELLEKICCPIEVCESRESADSEQTGAQAMLKQRSYQATQTMRFSGGPTLAGIDLGVLDRVVPTLLSRIPIGRVDPQTARTVEQVALAITDLARIGATPLDQPAPLVAEMPGINGVVRREVFDAVEAEIKTKIQQTEPAQFASKLIKQAVQAQTRKIKAEVEILRKKQVVLEKQAQQLASELKKRR